MGPGERAGLASVRGTRPVRGKGKGTASAWAEASLVAPESA
jgi:hypothetical protein